MTAETVEGDFIATMEDPDDPAMFERNRIHTNAGAQEYGFEGAFVGGVTLYGWCVPTIVDAIGEGWLDDGWINIRFRRPTYPGAHVRVRVAPSDVTPQAFLVQALHDDGEVSIVGEAGTGTAPWLADLRATPFSPPEPPGERPLLTLEDAPSGRRLRSFRYGKQTPDPSHSAAAQAGIVEFGTSAGSVVHPGTVARQMISLLAHSYEYGRPAIHTESYIQTFARIPADEDVVLCGTFIRAFERNGHHYAVIDADLYTLSGERLARQRHINIFKVRPSTVTP